MIRKPNEHEQYCLEQRLGPSVLAYFLEMVDTINAHMGDKERHVNGPVVVEESDAGERTQDADQNPRLPRTELGE